LAALVGQPDAARALRAAAAKPVHAYLFVGPAGTGKLAAAKAFAAMLLCANGGEDGCATCVRVAAGAHPDVVVVEREGAAISIDQAREVARIAARSSVEGGRVVVVLPDLHLAREAVPALLKTIEEPSGPVVFVVLAEMVPPQLVTVASRCVRVDFRPLGETELRQALVAEGVAPERASAVAAMAGGRLDRARLLAADPGAEARRGAWAAVPARLGSSGATVAQLADELVQLLEQSAAPLAARQASEVAALAERNKAAMSSVPSKLARAAARSYELEIEERHKREQRRQRTDELRSGLAALAGAYRDRAASGAVGAGTAAAAVGLVDALSADLVFNPGELLSIQALLVRLDRLATR